MIQAELVTNLARAKALLAAGEFTCVLCNQERVLTATAPGISPMLDFIAAGVDLHGFSAADKVVGKAAALLMIHAGVAEVYAPLGSHTAIEVLANAGIPAQFDVVVGSILNTTGTSICPMEHLVAETDDPIIAFQRLSAAVAQRRAEAQIDPPN